MCLYKPFVAPLQTALYGHVARAVVWCLKTLCLQEPHLSLYNKVYARSLSVLCTTAFDVGEPALNLFHRVLFNPSFAPIGKLNAQPTLDGAVGNVYPCALV